MAPGSCPLLLSGCRGETRADILNFGNGGGRAATRWFGRVASFGKVAKLFQPILDSSIGRASHC